MLFFTTEMFDDTKSFLLIKSHTFGAKIRSKIIFIGKMKYLGTEIILYSISKEV